MRGETRIWFLSAFFFFPLLYAVTEYECGAHGRFEYCVDGIPGCVVGCHCHPGYYFDTDSKICEHNSKLTKGAFRRYYNPEPTRIPDVEIMTPPNKIVSTTSTTSNPIEEKIDEITKDADDLGDWLYNQFFKTIENQVINQTQDEVTSPSRRSGDQLNKPSRKSHHRSRRHKQKKKKSKSKSLKSKLLRITEDDSLFDSSSGSSSNSEEDESSASSEESCPSSEKKDDGHGHKKILIYNKKPQPPLPSFIFLPNNMDSSFFPPMGMPVPPMPMYPMVPVPPMMPGPQMGPPLFPFPGPLPPCDATSAVGSDPTPTTTAEHTTPTTTTTAETPTTTAKPTAEDEPPPLPPDDAPPPDNDEPDVENPPALRSRLKKKKNKLADIKKKIARPALRDRRNKLLKRLREKMNRKNKLENYYMAEQYQDPNVPLDVPDAEFGTKNNFMPPYMHEMLPEQRDVDFKYLADLIHKADLNKTLNQNTYHHETPSNAANQIPKSIPGMIPLESIGPMPNRRNNYQTQIANQPVNNFRRFEPRTQINDTFYTDLGKQIASMIRKIDTVGDREVNIEIEGPNRPLLQSPVFNENNYASRSFWERSVRSPMRHVGSFRNEMENIKRSNEDLFDLERRVEIAASTVRSLSLHDLENIISIVQRRRTQAKRNSIKSDNSKTSFKFDLLPNNINTNYNIMTSKINNSNTSFKFDLLPNNIDTNYNIMTSRNIQTLSVHKTNNVQTTIPPNIQKQIIGTWVKKPIAKIVVNRKMNKEFEYTGIMPVRKIKKTKDFLPISSPYFNAPVLTSNNFNSMSHIKSNIKTQDVRPTRKPIDIVTTPAQRIISYIMPSVAKVIQIKQKSHNNNFYSFHKNPYLFDNPVPIMQYTAAGLTKNILPNGRLETPSYFHHEFHHFDYIDK